jgi:Ca2+/Na+ antiporter
LRVLNGTEPHGYSRALTAQVGSAVITAPATYRRSTSSSAELRRRRTLERRRNVLFVLTGLCVGTLLFSFAMGSKMFLVNILCDLMLAAYVALLVQLRNAAAERETKLRYLPRQQRVLDLRDAELSSSFYDEVAAWGEANAVYAGAR